MEVVSVSQREYDDIQEELENVQYHMRLTREHIDELNARFASYKELPSICVSVSD